MDVAVFLAAIAVLILVVTILIPLLIGISVVRLVDRRAGGIAASVLALALVAGWAISPLPRGAATAAFLAIPPARIPLVKLDLLLSRAVREEIVRQVASGELEHGHDAGELELPANARGLSVHGTVERIDGCGLRVFFLTLTAMSPDPYGGFEFVSDGCAPETDPLGSGRGVATALTGNWYWIDAR